MMDLDRTQCPFLVFTLDVRYACHCRPVAYLCAEVLLQHRIYDWVNVLIQVLKKEGEAILDGHLELLQEVTVIEGLDLSFQLFALTPLDPCHCLQYRSKICS